MDFKFLFTTIIFFHIFKFNLYNIDINRALSLVLKIIYIKILFISKLQSYNLQFYTY